MKKLVSNQKLVLATVLLSIAPYTRCRVLLYNVTGRDIMIGIGNHTEGLIDNVRLSRDGKLVVEDNTFVEIK